MKRKILVWTCGAGLAVIALAALVIANRESVSARLGDALGSRAEKAQATLFRLGELGSLSGELDRKYGARPEMTYEIEGTARVVTIRFEEPTLPAATSLEDRARELATYAMTKTAKTDEVDRVDVYLSSGQVWEFPIEDLLP